MAIDCRSKDAWRPSKATPPMTKSALAWRWVCSREGGAAGCGTTTPPPRLQRRVAFPSAMAGPMPARLLVPHPSRQLGRSRRSATSLVRQRTPQPRRWNHRAAGWFAIAANLRRSPHEAAVSAQKPLPRSRWALTDLKLGVKGTRRACGAVRLRRDRPLAQAVRPPRRTTSPKTPVFLSVVPTYRLRRRPSCPVPFQVLSARRHYGALALHPGRTRLSRFWSNSWAAPFWGKQQS